MGRPSKLTDKQWAEIEKRLIAGESRRKLAKEYGVSESAMRQRLSARVSQIKDVANQIVATDLAIKALPVSAQIAAHNLAEELKAISLHLAGAAKYGAATSHRLAGIAHSKVQEIDDAKPMDDESREALRDVAVLTKLANESANIPMSLLAANKDLAKEINQGAKPIPQRVQVDVVDASVQDADAQ